MPRRPRPRTVALPMAVTLLTLAGLTALLARPDEAITVTIGETSIVTNPPGSSGPKTYNVSGVSVSGRAIYKKVANTRVSLARKVEHGGFVEFRAVPTAPGYMAGASFSYPGTPDDYRQAFSARVIPSLPVDETGLFLQITPHDTAGRRQSSVYVPVKRD